MTQIKVRVEHWSYHDGYRCIFNSKEYDSSLMGWHCWVYPEDDLHFVQWMANNMRGCYECDWRFNSGDPMYTVMIAEDEDAALFKIRWM